MAWYFFASPLENRVHQPLFGRIAYGMDADNFEVVRSIIAIGGEVYLDDNDNGKADESELIAGSKPSKLAISDNKHLVIQKCDLLINPESIAMGLKQGLLIEAELPGTKSNQTPFSYRMTGKIELEPNLQDANTLHFGGPLQFLIEKKTKLKDNQDQEQELKVYVGTCYPEATENLFDANHSTVVIPEDSLPIPAVALTFQKDDQSSEFLSQTLDHFC